MASQASMPIALDLSRRSDKIVDVLLSHTVSLDVEDNIDVLRIGNSDEKVKVPSKCLDTLRLVIHQFRIYQQLVKKLTDLPETTQTQKACDMYIAIVAYLAQVTSAFYKEVMAESSSSTTKWRSVYLDYHLAMALHNSAFTQEQQATALKEMKRTWAQFKERKRYPKVQEMFGKQLHEKFCSDGHNMCGGPFEHAMSVDAMVSMMLGVVTGVTPPPPPTAGPAAAQNTNVEPSSSKGTNAVATSDGSVVPPASMQGNEATPIDVEMLSPPKKTTSRSKKPKKDARHKRSVVVESGSKSQNDSADDTVESPIQALATIFEGNEDAKRKPKDQRAMRPRKGGKASGKKKASSPAMKALKPMDVDDEISLVNDSFVATLKATRTVDGSQSSGKQKGVGKKKVGLTLMESLSDGEDMDVLAAVEESFFESLNSEMLNGPQEDEECYDDTTLPSLLDDWEDWTRIAFERGNSRVFLKLASWMLLRYRQLANIEMDADIEGVIIPENPRLRDDVDTHEFYEAVGMERLYSAIVHMDTRPRYLTHLFHALGKAITESDIGQSHPHIRPICSPPVVDAEILSDMDIPWLHLQDDDGDHATTDIEAHEDADAIGSPDLDVGALSLMDDLRPTVRVDAGSGSGAERVEKRKRSQSLASPPKTDGGRGPSKRPKDGDGRVPRIQSPSPIQSASGFDDPAFHSTQHALVPTQIIDTGDDLDNAPAIMEPWEALGSPSPSLIGDEVAYGSPVPSVASRLSLPPVVYVEGTPSVESSAANHCSPQANAVPRSPTPPVIAPDERGDLEHSPEPGTSRPKEHTSTTPALAGDECELWLSRLTDA